MAVALIGLGSNVGDRHAALRKAVERLRASAGVTDIQCSRWHVTSPVGGPAKQGAYLNGAVRLVTSLAPASLLALLQDIERSAGRIRRQRWGPRTLDLDLLLYDRAIFKGPRLEVPHPRMAFRRFVLTPAAEVAADMLQPVIGWTVGELLAHLDTAADYVAIAAADQFAGNLAPNQAESPPSTERLPTVEDDRVRSRDETSLRTWLARRLHQRFPGRLIVQPAAEDLPDSPRDASRTGRSLADAIKWMESVAEAFGVPEVGVQQLESGVSRVRRRWLTVSDFWFAELLAGGEWVFRGDDLRRFRAAWHAKAESVPQPKLLLVLGGPAGCVAASREDRNAQRGGWPTQENAKETGGPVRPDAEQSLPGPTLWLPAERRSDALREAVAAIEAIG